VRAGLIDLGKLHSSFASQHKLRCKTLEATQHARVPPAHSPSSNSPPHLPNYIGFHTKSWKHPPGVQEFFNSKDTATIIIDPLLLRRITNLLKFFVYQVLHQLLLLLKSTTVLKEMIHLPKLEVLQIRNKIYKVEQFYT
jgi:hypothetical protein